MSKLRPLFIAALRHPLLWGGIATVLFYVTLDAGLVTDPLALRYLTGHWAAYVCTTMFLVGIAAVVIKAIDLVGDFAALNGALFEGLPASDLPLSDVPLFMQRLDASRRGTSAAIYCCGCALRLNTWPARERRKIWRMNCARWRI